MKKFALIFVSIFVLTGWFGDDFSKQKQAISSLMKDPESTQFKDFTVKKYLSCGLINSKNSFGGFTGFERFVFDNGQIFLESNFNAQTINTFETLWKICHS